MEFTKIYNKSADKLQLFVDGDIHHLKPHEETRLDESVADLWLETHPQKVEKVVLGRYIQKAESVTETMFIVNVTGNPNAPDTVRTRGKGGVLTEVPNPIKAARTLKWYEDGGMEEYQTRGGTFAKNKVGITYEARPYARVLEVPRATGSWILRRVANSGEPGSPAAIRARPPGDFEPDEYWELSDIRTYAELVDSSLINNKTMSETKLRSLHLKDKSAASEKKFSMALLEEKETLLKGLFFKIVDPTVILPTRSQFKARKAKKAEKKIA